jgi:hypothetical protein
MPVDQEAPRTVQGQAPQTAKHVHVKVVDENKQGRPAVNITVPIGVVKFGLNMAKTFSPQMKNADVDWDAVTAMIEEGATGEIVHVQDEAEHKTVDVWVE